MVVATGLFLMPHTSLPPTSSWLNCCSLAAIATAGYRLKLSHTNWHEREAYLGFVRKLLSENSHEQMPIKSMFYLLPGFNVSFTFPPKIKENKNYLDTVFRIQPIIRWGIRGRHKYGSHSLEKLMKNQKKKLKPTETES